jgi:hypothetical protein
LQKTCAGKTDKFIVVDGLRDPRAVIACVGLYGTVSYNVARRTSEIGIRVALAAQRARVVRMILCEGFHPICPERFRLLRVVVNGFMLIDLIAGDHQARRVVSSRQCRPRSTTSRETSVKTIRPTAAKVSPRWLQ